MTTTKLFKASFLSRKRSRLLLLFMSAVVLVTAWWAWDSRTPRYRGHSAAWWFARYETDLTAQDDVIAAFRAMGGKAVPFLISQLECRPSRLIKALDSVVIRFRPREPYERRLLFRQERASRLLGEMGKPAQAAIPALEATASNPMWFVWTAAKAALIKIRGDSFARYIELLKDRRDCIAWYPNAMLLGELGTNASAAVPVLLDSLQHTNGIIQAHALIALGMIGSDPKNCVPAMIPFLTNQDRALRQKAFYAVRCFKSGAQAASGEFRLGLSDGDPWIRIQCLLAAEEVLSPADLKLALPEIEALLDDPAPYVKGIAQKVVPKIRQSASK